MQFAEYEEETGVSQKTWRDDAFVSMATCLCVYSKLCTMSGDVDVLDPV
jgi:hypothetical protein